MYYNMKNIIHLQKFMFGKFFFLLHSKWQVNAHKMATFCKFIHSRKFLSAKVSAKNTGVGYLYTCIFASLDFTKKMLN